MWKLRPLPTFAGGKPETGNQDFKLEAMTGKKLVFSILLTICLQASGHAQRVKGSDTLLPLTQELAEIYLNEHPGAEVIVTGGGSGVGIAALPENTTDIAMASRRIKFSEKMKFAEIGLDAREVIVAYDALAVVVNPSNPVDSLTREQLEAIFRGKITNWKEVGGDDAQIIIVSRDTNSGTYETFNELVLHKKDVAKNAEYVGSNGHARTRVNSTKYAIGYVGLGFVDDTVKPLSVNGILPTAKSISSGKYAIARPLYMFTDAYPKMGSDIYNFVTLHLSNEGREIIKDLGYIPVCE